MTIRSLPFKTTFWREKEEPLNPQLKGNTRVDVAVIGGGFAGLSSARFLKETAPSLQVALLEAEYVGFGASGRNGGFLSPLPPITWLIGSQQEEHLEEFQWGITFLQRQTSEFKRYIDNNDLSCGLQPTSLVLAPRNENQWKYLKKIAKRCEMLRIPFRMMSTGEMKEHLRFPSSGGMSMEGYVLQPYELVRGLLRIVLREGIQVYENTRVTTLKPAQNGVEVLTEHGARILAGKVVVATNAYTSRLGLPLKRFLLIPLHTYLIATEPLDSGTLHRLHPDDVFLGDASAEFFYGRIYANRFLFGGIDRLSKVGENMDRDPQSHRRLYREMVSRYPFLTNVPLAAVWGGPYQERPMGTPLVREMPGTPDIILNIGYGGGGLLLTQFSGKMTAGLVLGSGYIQDEAERMRRIYESTPVPVRDIVKLALRMWWGL